MYVSVLFFFCIHHQLFTYSIGLYSFDTCTIHVIDIVLSIMFAAVTAAGASGGAVAAVIADALCVHSNILTAFVLSVHLNLYNARFGSIGNLLALLFTMQLMVCVCVFNLIFDSLNSVSLQKWHCTWYGYSST